MLVLSACSTPLRTPLSSPASPTNNATQADLTVAAATLTPIEQPPITPATPLPTALPSEFESTPTPDISPAIDRLTAYSLKVTFDYYQHSLEVDETIEYTNSSGQVLEDLLLVVEANRYPGAFTLTGMYWADGAKVDGAEMEGNQMRIPLPSPLPASESLRLEISYTLALPLIPDPSATTRPVPFGYTSRQTNLVDWYPFVPPYQAGKGWLAHQAWFYGEHQVYELGDYQVEINLPEPVQGLVIAASAAGVQEGNRYTYQMQGARTFVFSASQMYQVQTASVGEVSVSSYYFAYDLEAGEMALQNTVDALKLYEVLFSPYLHNSLSVVEADFLDGMEYSGLYFLSRGFYNLYDGTPRGYLTTIAAHETAHQWWYGAVGNDQALEPWLDEALCTYSERLFYEATYPELLDWWWQFRVDLYEPQGKVNSSISDYGGFRPYRDAVYLRGAQFIEQVRIAIGDDAFFDFLNDYAKRNAGRIATAGDFFAILSEHTSVDLSNLLEEYFSP
ncbi:MAG: M1 family metallopeptidase [Anaerolineales bacterium]|nr:M1 family metallopeptidase [Anaerolineales bacterium]